MYFTQEVIEQLAKILQERGVKDTQFNKAQPLTGNEVMALVQDNVNVQTSLKELAQIILPLIVYKEGEIPIIDSLESDNAEAALSAKQGKILKDLIETIESSVGKNTVTLTSDFDLGGIKKGTVFEHTPLSEMFKALLVEEYAPCWADASLDLGLPYGVEPTMCVGDSMPAQIDFNISGNPAKASTVIDGEDYVAQNSYTSVSNIQSDVGFGSTVDTRKIAHISAIGNFSGGITKVKSSKGNDTNKTAPDNITPLIEATENAQIANGYVKAMQVTGQNTIKFAYPVYVNGIAQPLDYDKTCYGEDKDIIHKVTSSTKLEIEVPKSYKNFNLYYWDNVTEEWINLDIRPSLTKTKTIGSNNISVTYNSYEFTEITGSRPYKFTFEF